jgi:TDG/mug DNA glycosylase family protein
MRNPLHSVLDDLLQPGLQLLVCGTAASERSATLGHYYAGPGNKFWRTLAVVGLTPRQLAPSEYRLLASVGIGLTDIAKTQSGADAEIRFAQKHRHELAAKVMAYQPRYLCFNGKRAAKEFFGRKDVSFGFEPDLLGITQVFVAPSTSGAANGAWDISLWRQLANRVLGDTAAAAPRAGTRGRDRWPLSPHPGAAAE